jgi:hypothetical protein
MLSSCVICLFWGFDTTIKEKHCLIPLQVGQTIAINEADSSKSLTINADSHQNARKWSRINSNKQQKPVVLRIVSASC